MSRRFKAGTRIASVATVEPPHSRSTAEILPLVEAWLAEQPERFRQKVLRLFKYAGVERRYSIFGPDEVFAPTSFAQRNQQYIERMLPLAEQALAESLQQAGIEPGQLDMLITTSCTGITIPGLDALLINRLRLRRDILRLPVFQMGCAGGVAGTIYAAHLLESQPNSCAAVLTIESPVATLQHDDLSMTNMVSAAIFGDGIACAVLSNEPARVASEACLPMIVDAEMYHFFDEERLMGFDLVDRGLQMVLAPDVPEKIEHHFEALLRPFLENNGLTLADIDHFVFHPGGRKILKLVDELLGDLGKNVEHSYEVLRRHGNMSSATVLYVLKRFLEREPTPGARGLMLSFGPGFTAQRVLLRWEGGRS